MRHSTSGCSADMGCVKLLCKKVWFSCLLQQMSRDTFLSEVLYEADKALEKFTAVLRECACLQDGGRPKSKKPLADDYRPRKHIKVTRLTQYLSSAYISSRLLCIGVPVRAQRLSAARRQTDCAVRLLWFLMLWASSMIIRRHRTIDNTPSWTWQMPQYNTLTWNALPNYVCLSDSLALFKSRLKTALFTTALASYRT